MALPLTLVIVAAEIDLSVASVLALSSALMAYAVERTACRSRLIIPICLGRRRAVRRLQRPARHPPRAAVARRHDRHARAVPRARLRGHRRRVGRPTSRPYVDRPRLRQLRRHVHPQHDRAVRRAGHRASRVLLHATPFGRSVLRDRRQRGGGVLLGPARQAHQADPVRRCRAWSPRSPASSSRCATRPRAANVGQGFELTVDHRGAARRRLDLRRPRHDRRASSSRCSCSAASRRRCC